MTSLTAGYDIGGAHLKVALADGARIVNVRQIPCALWQGMDRLGSAFSDAQDLIARADRHAVTMTGELCEIFASRAEGVRAIARYAAGKLGSETLFFAGLSGFAHQAAVVANPLAAASTNFLATARVVAALRPNALLIDMGSTTTDIVACDRPLGLSDAERLQTGELVYTGLTRTPVPSVTTRAPLLGQWQGLARDCFATMGDVRRLLGTLPEGADADSDTLEITLARFSRGFGRDGELRHIGAWRQAAAYIREQQLQSILDGAAQVLARPGIDVTSAVVAGCGAGEATEIAQRLGLTCTGFGNLIGADAVQKTIAQICAPAVAVALLAAKSTQ